jgi:heme oxygenase (biliverdin-IX-beta and delta-forming)
MSAPVIALDLLARMRHETRPYHDALEQNPFNQALLREDVTKAVVERFLAKMYGFLLPYEAQLHAAALPPACQADERRRAHLIREDLGAARADALPHCAALPPLGTETQLLGAMYVLEGSTLGGQFIGQALAKAGLPPSAYFTGYGPQTGALWKAFGQQLTQTVTSAADQDAVVAAAVLTFQSLAQWINYA